MRVVAAVLLLVAAGLAGCAGNGQVDSGTGPDDTPSLQAGKGAITGLLVDDAFRPLHLVDGDPEVEYQARGFILVQETGQQMRSNANGEFRILNLDPGRYTLRTTASGHEATPYTVNVEAGLFAEATIIARRVVSLGGTIITEEYSAFSPCFINFVALSYTADCTGDASGETFRPGIRSRDVSDIPEVTWIVAEAFFNQEPRVGAAYDLVIRRSIGHDYSAAVLFEGQYVKLHILNGTVSPDPPVPGADFEPWYVHNGTFEMLMFGRGYLSEEIRQAYAPVWGTLQQVPVCIPTGLGICAQDIPMRRGAGGTLGNKAQMMLSIFLGEPEVDPLEYCVLCADAAPPT